MKCNFFIILMFLNINCIAAQNIKKIQTKTYVSGTVKEIIDTGQFKSGYEITKISKVLEAASFKVIQGEKYKGQDEIVSFRTGTSGHFLLELPPGDYLIVESDRPLKFKAPENKKEIIWDKRCLKRKWSEGLASFHLELGDPIIVSVDIYKYAETLQPCIKKRQTK